jgi:hypothetical protein
LLVLALLVVLAFVFWDFNDPNGFRIFWDNIADAFNINR